MPASINKTVKTKSSLSWWKIVSVLLICYTIFAGFTQDVPALPVLNETIRNLYFHVTMWFGMIIILFVSLWHSVKYLSGFDIKHDIVAKEAANVGMLLGGLGIVTGMIWANYTWGDWWVNDPKLNGAAITMLFYLAYTILRNSLDEEQKRARIGAIYNIFAYVMLIVFLMILPRMTDSLHPGNGGNPGFGGYDLDNKMKLVFYPAVIGWTLLGVWIMELRIRYVKLQREITKNL